MFPSEAHPVITRMSMKGLEDQLPQDGFLRIHKSYIVSKAAITALRKNSVYLGTMELPVGEAYREAVYALVQGGRGGEL